MKKNSFTYNTLFMTFANIITRVTAFFYRIFLSRFIGAEGLGLYALVTPIYSICCAVVASGIPVAAMKKISECKTADEKKAMTYSSLRIVFIVSLCLFVLLFFLSKPLSYLLGDVRTYPSLIILSFAVLITGFENVYKSSFYSDCQVKIPAFTEIAEQLFRIATVICLLIFFAGQNITLGSAVLTFGVFAGEALSLLILFYLYLKKTKNLSKKRLSIKDSGLVGIAAPVTGAKCAESIIGSISNILIPFCLTLYGYERGEATSVLGVISGMIMPLLYLPSVFTNAVCVNLVPFISKNLALKNNLAVAKKINKTIKITSIFVFPCCFSMIFFKDTAAEIIFSDSRVAVFLPPMAIGGLIAIFRHILNSVMNACGEERRSSYYSFAGNLLQMLIICIFIPLFGPSGYIFSYVFSNLIMLIPSCIIVKKVLYLDSGTLKEILFPFALSLFSFIVVSPLYSYFLVHNGLFFSSFVSFLLAGFIYVFTLFLTCFKKKIIFFSKIT